MFKAAILLVLAAVSTVAQSNVQKLVDAEHAFAALAADKGTKTAFLAYMTDDAVVFNPEKVNARTNWMSKGESKGLLSWAPNFADLSFDGSLGYSTGNWEYRPKGKADTPVAFGDFVTVWRRQADGQYKWVIDIGVSHDKPSAYSTDWQTSAIGRDKIAARTGIDAAVAEFAAVARQNGIGEAYSRYAGDNVRIYRPEKLPILGKNAAISTGQSESKVNFAAAKAIASSNLAYVLTEYDRAAPNAAKEKGYVLQIWKLYAGKWHLELDIFDPVTSK